MRNVQAVECGGRLESPKSNRCLRDSISSLLRKGSTAGFNPAPDGGLANARNWFWSKSPSAIFARQPCAAYSRPIRRARVDFPTPPFAKR